MEDAQPLGGHHTPGRTRDLDLNRPAEAFPLVAAHRVLPYTSIATLPAANAPSRFSVVLSPANLDERLARRSRPVPRSQSTAAVALAL
jgi:hypothetical protein